MHQGQAHLDFEGRKHMQSKTMYQADEIDVRRLWDTLRGSVWGILGISVTLAAGAYLLESRKPPVYDATSSVVAIRADGGNSLINNTLVSAPPLPLGTVAKALQSPEVVEDIIRRLEKSPLSKADVSRLATDLRNELATNKYEHLLVESKIDSQLMGIYTVHAKSDSAKISAELANASVQALLSWDVNRATARVIQARRSFEEQQVDIDRRLASVGKNSLEYDTLIQARNTTLQNLSQVAVLERAASGTLNLIGAAVEPLKAIGPRPQRSAIFGLLFGLIFSTIGALLLSALGRVIKTEDDLLLLGLPVLGRLPKLKPKATQNFIELVQSGELYEAIGFLRVSILSLLSGSTERNHKRIAITSARPGEGKSSISASLAIGFAESGLRVLIIDADMHRPTQDKVWNIAQMTHKTYKVLPGAQQSDAPALDLPTALSRPNAACALSLLPNLDVLPAGPALRDASHILSKPNLAQLLDTWGTAYDIILIDTPPILALADALMVAPYTDGLLLVVESGKTQAAALEKALSSAQLSGVRVLGFALNKLARRSEGYYNYGYGYRSRYRMEAVEKRS